MTRPPYEPDPRRSPLDELVYRSRLLGGQADLVLFGGGNTSSKVTLPDHLGRLRPVLHVKASGANLATLTADGVVSLYLDDLLTLQGREAMTDEEMTEFLGRCVAGNVGRRGSIETLLHAFIPARHVDHVHADVLCALSRTPDARAVVRDALGDDVAYVEWIRPGFALSKRAGTLANAEAIMLGHHGLVAWGDEPGESYDRTIRIIERAERYLAKRSRSVSPARAAMPVEERERLLLTLRGRLSRRRHRILAVDESGRAVADRPDTAEIVRSGPATADHLMHIRPWPVVIRSADEVETTVTTYEQRYEEYWARHQAAMPEGYAMHDPAPAVAMVPGLGFVAAGRSAVHARMVCTIALHSQGAAAAALDALGTATPVSDADLFAVDYWPLELAKLRTTREPLELEGRVFVVTGAAGAIGRAVAASLAAQGAQLVLTDREAGPLAALETELVRAGGQSPLSVVGDVTDEAAMKGLVRSAVLRFGGLDGAVLNAGIAVTGALESVSLADWERSLAVNTTGYFLATRELLRVLRLQGLGGSLVYVASKNAFSPGAGFGPYSVAKAGQVQLARMAAIEGGPARIRANVVSPDAIFEGSNLWSAELRAARAAAHGISESELETFYASRNLLGARIRAGDVAESVAFLLSDRSSRTTGCVITVDGGLVSAFPR